MHLAYSSAAFARWFDRSKYNEGRAVSRPRMAIGGPGAAFGSFEAAYIRRLADLNKFRDARGKLPQRGGRGPGRALLGGFAATCARRFARSKRVESARNRTLAATAKRDIALALRLTRVE